MKKIIFTTAVLCFCTASAFANDVPIAVSALPQPVTAALQEYFPGANPLSADQDRDDGLVSYEVRVQYKAIVLEVELTPEGRILDVDMKR